MRPPVVSCCPVAASRAMPTDFCLGRRGCVRRVASDRRAHVRPHMGVQQPSHMFFFSFNLTILCFLSFVVEDDQ
jgi:hypothetical protein